MKEREGEEEYLKPKLQDIFNKYVLEPLNDKYKTKETELLVELNNLSWNEGEGFVVINKKKYNVYKHNFLKFGIHDIKENSLTRLDISEILGTIKTKHIIRRLRNDVVWIEGDDYIRIPIKFLGVRSKKDLSQNYPKSYVEFISVSGFQKMLTRTNDKFAKELLYGLFKVLVIIDYFKINKSNYFEVEEDDYYLNEIRRKLKKCQSFPQEILFKMFIGEEIPLGLIEIEYIIKESRKRVDIFFIIDKEESGVAVELHGRQHFVNTDQVLMDYEKRIILQFRNIKLLEFTNKMFFDNPKKIITLIKKTIDNFISSDNFKKLKAKYNA